MKACIAKQVREFDFPDLKRARNSYTHDLLQLVKEAGLEVEVLNEVQNNSAFASKWLLTQRWSVESRYQLGCSKEDCQDFYTAVTDGTSGVLQWIKTHW